jgi:TolA-binding protein
VIWILVGLTLVGLGARNFLGRSASHPDARPQTSGAASMGQHVRHAQDDLTRAQIANDSRARQREARLQAESEVLRLQSRNRELEQTVQTQENRLRVLQNELDKRDDPFYDPPAPQRRA